MARSPVAYVRLSNTMGELQERAVEFMCIEEICALRDSRTRQQLHQLAGSIEMVRNHLILETKEVA